MKKSLKKDVLVILGNGFDLALGLKTSYQHFYNSPLWPFEPETVKKKQHLSRLLGVIPMLPNYKLLSTYLNSHMFKNWYNLERILTDYASSYKRNKFLDFANIFLKDNVTYQALINNSDSITGLPVISMNSYYNRDEFYGHLRLINLQEFLLLKHSLFLYIQKEQEEFLYNANVNKENKAARFLRKIYEKRSPIIYSFNYTDLTRMAKHMGIYHVVCTHVHGSIKDKNIILGTEENINNRPEYDFLKKMNAPSYKSTNLYYDLMNSKDVIFFGHSLGDSDYPYFKHFFEVHSDENKTDIKNKCNITIITANSESKNDILSKIRTMNNGRNNQLFALNNLQFIRIIDDDSGEKSNFEGWINAFQ